MKVRSIKSIGKNVCRQFNVGDGYQKRSHGSLADVDTDFPSEKRPDIKAYMENRYNHDGKQRVFSAGTFTTEKIKSVIKDVCRVHKIPVGTTNYITAIIKDDEMSWSDLMKLAVSEPKLMDFIQAHWEAFEQILPIIGQPRAAGIHPSALVVVPDTIKGEDVECFDVIPIRKMNGILVSELSGVDLDDMGLLKNDALSIAELSRLSDMLDICNREYKANVTIHKIVTNYLDDPAVYEMIRKGLTQGIFQMSGSGITRFIKQMKPNCIGDLIAAVALFRPATLDSGAAQSYCDSKNGLVDPEYLWGTYDALKDTFGQFCFQEQVSFVARKVGNLSLADGVNLVKAISKKKRDKVLKFKNKFFEGIAETKCPIDAAKQIWDNIEASSSYLFNRSHATAYALTGFVGAWIKVHYPIAFYTVMLKWVEKEKLPVLMNEMREIGSAKISAPDINISSSDFVTDYATNTIYWSLSRIKQLGVKTVDYIVKERAAYGTYDGVEHFIKRLLRHKFSPAVSADRVPVTSLIIKNLIYAGAFDSCDGIKSPIERLGLIKKAIDVMDIQIKDGELPESLIDRNYFWSQKQIDVSGIGSIDYKGIYLSTYRPDSIKSRKYCELKELNDDFPEKTKVAVCATVADVSERRYKDKKTNEGKKYGKITLIQNTDTAELVIWNDTWLENKRYFVVGSIVIFSGEIKYSDYKEGYILQMNHGSFVCSV